MNFKETETYLLSLGNEVLAMKLGLENIRKLLAELGDPQTEYVKVQVAGTNGKGSVCAFLNSICVNAGIGTGMFTSPHLVSMTERVKIDGVDLRDEKFAALGTRVREVSESLAGSGELENIPTYFEQVTAIALLAFADAKVELAILETGLGGRLDATTAANAEIAAITRIDLDHQQYLGDTIEEIAAEKAAIIHAGSEVVIGAQDPEALKVLLERCRSVGIEPYVAGGNPIGRQGVTDVITETPSQPVVFPSLGLAGRHQVENADVATAVAHVLSEYFSISDHDIHVGLQNVAHPGRLEWMGRYLLDGAHNIGGARALCNYLDEFVDRPITMIFGAMNDKNVKEIARTLFSRATKLIITRADNSRAIAPVDIVESAAESIDAKQIFEADNIEKALKKAQQVSSHDEVILVTGSLYLVGEARLILTAQTESEI